MVVHLAVSPAIRTVFDVVNGEIAAREPPDIECHTVDRVEVLADIELDPDWRGSCGFGSNAVPATTGCLRGTTPAAGVSVGPADQSSRARPTESQRIQRGNRPVHGLEKARRLHLSNHQPREGQRSDGSQSQPPRMICGEAANCTRETRR